MSTYQIRCHLEIQKATSTYTSEPLCVLNLTETVPPGVNPKRHLETRMLSEFRRVFECWTPPAEGDK